ncbi:MAG TPA: hypothetical protein VF637_08215, partial [Sphingomicrobium sp.]
RAARVVEHSASAIQWMDQPILASTQGGPIAVDEDASKSLKPREALYRVRFIGARRPGALYPVTGTIRVEAQPQSPAGRAFGSLARLLRAEGSFAD